MKFNFLLSSFVFISSILSCSAPKQSTGYLNDLDPNIAYPVKSISDPVVQKDDRIKITVSAKNPELAIPFNLQEGDRIQVDSKGDIVTTKGAPTSSGKGYLVDKAGDIDFPVLGQIHVEGLTLQQLKDLIRQKIISGNYIADPIVTTDFTNFKVMVLGEVNKKGILSVDADKMTLLEAIILSGDVSEKGRSDRVAVIRETGGKREIYWHDLHSKSVFDSPTFYLQQKDIVYVEPRPVKKERVNNILRYGTAAISTILAVASLIILIK